jgi:hypothetical protein
MVFSEMIQEGDLPMILWSSCKLNDGVSLPLLCLLAASSVHAADSVPDLLKKKLEALAGAGARDCGAITLSADRAAAVACARAAAVAGKAYRIAVQMHESDSYTWQGAARDEKGRQWVVFYDADASSGPAASPGLGQLLCRDISFAPDKDEVIDCTPSTGEP